MMSVDPPGGYANDYAYRLIRKIVRAARKRRRDKAIQADKQTRQRGFNGHSILLLPATNNSREAALILL